MLFVFVEKLQSDAHGCVTREKVSSGQTVVDVDRYCHSCDATQMATEKVKMFVIAPLYARVTLLRIEKQKLVKKNNSVLRMNQRASRLDFDWLAPTANES